MCFKTYQTHDISSIYGGKFFFITYNRMHLLHTKSKGFFVITYSKSYFRKMIQSIQAIQNSKNVNNQNLIVFFSIFSGTKHKLEAEEGLFRQSSDGKSTWIKDTTRNLNRSLQKTSTGFFLKPSFFLNKMSFLKRHFKKII